MSASKMLDLAEQQGLLEEKVISELRRQLRESKFIVTPEALAKVLVDHEHLTNFQARKLVASASEATDAPTTTRQAVAPTKAPAKEMLPIEEEEDIVDLEPAAPTAAKVDPLDELVDLEPAVPAAPQAPAAAPVPVAPAPSAHDSIDMAPLDFDENPKSSSKPVEPKPEKPKAEAAPSPPKSEPKPKPQPAPRGFKTLEKPGSTPPKRESKPAPISPPSIAPPVEDNLEVLTELTPLSVPSGPAPIDDLFAVDPIAGPAPLGSDPLMGGPLAGPLAGPLGQPAAAAGVVVPPKKKNQWDSPLLLIGGGALGVLLLAAGLLVYSLTRGSASELFQKGEEDYRSGSYSTAIAVFDEFLKKYPSDPNSSLARVRRGMAQIRQVTDKASDPVQGLKAAQQVLPQIEVETESFNEARTELASILPDIADGFATKAKDEPDTAKRVELVAKTEAAIALVNNPSYIPSSLRKDQEVRISQIIEKLDAARRSIDQDRDLQTAVEKMTAAADQNQAATGYATRRELLKKYPALEISESLMAATYRLSQGEQSQIEVRDNPLPAAPAAAAEGVIAIALSHAETAGTGATTGLVPVVVEGSLHAFDLGTGALKWHKYLGQGAPAVVVTPTGDWLAVDVRTSTLCCFEPATGSIKWRHAPGERFFGPVVGTDVAYISCESGTIYEIALADGTSPRQVKLPQKLSTAVGLDSRRSRIYQLGDHSTLFALRMETLACEETSFLGHLEGSILVPPLVVLDHVVIAESPGINYSVLRTLAPTGENKQLQPTSKVFRLAGRITEPLLTASRRVIAVTDLGQTSVIEIDPTSPQQSVREISKLEATDSEPTTTYPAVEANQVWLVGTRASAYEIQASLAQLARRWTLHPGDRFVAPLQFSGGVLVHARRRGTQDGILVEACNPADGKAVWTTRIAQQLAAVLIHQPRSEVFAATRGGLLYSIPRDALRQGLYATPQLTPPLGGGPISLSQLSNLGNNQYLISGFGTGNRGILCNLEEKEKSRYTEFSSIDGSSRCTPLVLGSSVIVPLEKGPVQAVNPLTGEAPIFPFTPPLKAGAKFPWLSPLLLEDGKNILLSDGGVMLYKLVERAGTPPQLALAGESTSTLPLAKQLARVASTIVGVGRGEAVDSLVTIHPQTLAVTETKKLAGRVTSGPFAALDLVLVATQPEGIIALGADGETKWILDYSDQLAGPPVVLGSDLLLVSTSGKLVRVEGATGKIIATGEIGRVVTGVNAVLETRLAVAAADGQLLFVTIPKPASP